MRKHDPLIGELIDELYFYGIDVTFSEMQDPRLVKIVFSFPEFMNKPETETLVVQKDDPDILIFKKIKDLINEKYDIEL